MKKVSCKITEFDKEKCRDKEYNNSHSAKSSNSSNILSVRDRVSLNNTHRLIIIYLNINFLRKKLKCYKKLCRNFKLYIFLVSGANKIHFSSQANLR